MFSLQASRASSFRSSKVFYATRFLHPSIDIQSFIMNKAELIEAIAHDTDMSKAAAGRALNAVLETIVKAVAKKQDVQLMGFGTFKSAKRTARVGKNPRTGEAVKIAAATVPKFSAGAAFKAAVNKKR